MSSAREPGSDDDYEPDDEGALVPLGEVLAATDAYRIEATSKAAADILRTARTPPHSMDAERAVLGAMLMAADVVDDVLDTGLVGPDFYRAHHGTVFEAIVDLRRRNEPADVLTVVDDLQRRGQLDAVGGAAAISQLEAALPTTAHAVSYARIVHDQAIRRRIILEATETVRQAYAQDRPAAELVEGATTRLMEMTSAKQGSVVDRAAVVRDVMGAIGKKGARGLPTGFDVLDTGLLSRGLRPSQMVVVGARPAMGKTAFAHQLASNVADMGIQAAFFSMEMDGHELIEREIAGKARLPSSLWPTASGNKAGRLQHAAGFVSERSLHIVHCPGAGLARISAELRRLVARQGVGLAVVDHLGLMAGSGRRENRTQEVGANSRGLKMLAGELGIPIVVLSQLNRGVESRDSKRPGLGDLRDTGDIEQDADVVMFLHRPEYYLKENTPEHLKGICEVVVEKQRNGPTGVASLFFSAETTRFINAVES